MNKYIDLFAGCGGLSLGLYNAGWDGLFVIEKSKMAFETLYFNLIQKKNHFSWPKWLPMKENDIKEVLENYEKELKLLRGKVDLIVGGPPCQGFSTAGRRNPFDERNMLIKFYLKFIKIIMPKFVFFENVRGFTMKFKDNKNNKPYSESVILELKNMGYDVDSKIIDFSNFGVPQRRKRFIIFGTLEGNSSNFFSFLESFKKDFLRSKGLEANEKVSVSEAISDLFKSNGLIESLDSKNFKAGKYNKSNSLYQYLMRFECDFEFPDSHRFPKHQEKSVEKFKTILKFSKKNKNVGKFIRKKYNMKKQCIIPLDGNKCSPTLTTLPDDYIHFKEPRILTVREYARIQSFPDWFQFRNKYTSGGMLRRVQTPRYTQVGNAVSPLFSEIVGNVIKSMNK